MNCKFNSYMSSQRFVNFSSSNISKIGEEIFFYRNGENLIYLQHLLKLEEVFFNFAFAQNAICYLRSEIFLSRRAANEAIFQITYCTFDFEPQGLDINFPAPRLYLSISIFWLMYYFDVSHNIKRNGMILRQP